MTLPFLLLSLGCADTPCEKGETCDTAAHDTAVVSDSDADTDSDSDTDSP
jgi:hypothetical protein